MNTKRSIAFYFISMLLVVAIGGTVFTVLLFEGLIK
jgi:cbb3-type cytochrome oxidase cytochrome c subunit